MITESRIHERYGAVARLLLSVVVLLTVALFPFAHPSRFMLQLAELSLIYGLLAISLNISFGRLNSLSFCQVAFFGLGAYVTGATFQHTGAFWVALLLTLAAALGASIVVGLITAHLSGFQFAIVTLAIAGLFQSIVMHSSLTGSSTGIILFNDVHLDLGFASYTLVPESTYVLTAVAFGFLTIATDSVLRTRVGSILLGVRDHPNFSRSLGFSPSELRLGAFVLTSVLGALAGCLYFVYQGIAAPTLFDQQTALLLALMVVIGGKDYFWAPIFGAIAFEVGPPVVGIAQNFVWLGVGGLMIVFVIVFPRGVAYVGSSIADRLYASRRTPGSGLEQEVIGRALTAVHQVEQRPRVEGLLRVEHVAHSFAGLKALDDVSLTVNGGGEVVGIVGTNGSGKTTLFNVISGYLVPDLGSVIFNGLDMTGARREKIALAGLVRTFQEGAAFPSLTVQECFKVAEIGAKVSARGRYIRAAVSGYFETPWIRRDVRVGRLSHGTQRLLMIGMAFATQPRLVLLDEPAAGLGAQEARWVLDVIRGASARGISVLLIEHHMDIVTNVCDRLLVLGSGREVISGTPTEVLQDARVVETLLGRFGQDALAIARPSPASVFAASIRETRD